MVAICVKTGPRRWQEKTLPVETALDYLKFYAGKRDVYISQQRFRYRRNITSLLALDCLHVDIDFHKVEKYQDCHPAGVLQDEILPVLEREGIPFPTMGIASGRGLYLIWNHHHIARTALPRWDACQKRLVKLLESFGADPRARDAARVLRVVGTKHRKANADVESLLPLGEVFDFDTLARKILPRAPRSINELQELQEKRVLRAAKRGLEGTSSNLADYDARTLWAKRLDDLEKIRELRWAACQWTDHRQMWMFLMGCAVGWTVGDADYDLGRRRIREEMIEIAAQAVGWHDRRTEVQLGTVLRRTEAAWRGERVEYQGQSRDMRYHFKNKTIIEEYLYITPYEEQFMSTIISDTERLRRDRERKALLRRDAGMMHRAAYEKKAAQKREVARRLAGQGQTKKQIAEALGVHPKTVQRYIR